MPKNLAKSVDKKDKKKLLKRHEEISDWIRNYYNNNQSLKLGVILDASIFGLGINNIQNLIAPQMTPFVPNLVSGVNDAGFDSQGRKPLGQGAPEKVVREADVHYQLGGRSQHQQPPPTEMNGLNAHPLVPVVTDRNIKVMKTGFINHRRFGLTGRAKTYLANIKIKV